MAVLVLQDKCKGCKLCLKACPFEAIDIIDNVAVINEKCTSCGACVEACSFKAIIKEETDVPKKDLSGYKNVWVFAEQREGKIMPVVIELLGEGRKLADKIGCELCAIVLGNNANDLQEELITYGADKVYVAQDELLENYTTDAYTKVITDAINESKPEIVLLGATHIGRDLAPRVAARVDTGLTADCTKLEIDSDDKKIMQTRPAFGGNIMATIVCPNHRPQMSTVRPGVMDKANRDDSRKGEVIQLEVKLSKEDVKTEVVEIVKTKKEIISLTDAEVIIAGGRGLGKPEGFDLIEQLANKLDGIVGASRAAVDNGWIDHSHQVGQTGTTVKPKLYIACGISGAIQHMAGMQNSDMIIAINENPDAPIFKIADFGIVGDLYKVIPAFMEALDRAENIVEALKEVESTQE